MLVPRPAEIGKADWALLANVNFIGFSRIITFVLQLLLEL